MLEATGITLRRTGCLQSNLLRPSTERNLTQCNWFESINGHSHLIRDRNNKSSKYHDPLKDSLPSCYLDDRSLIGSSFEMSSREMLTVIGGISCGLFWIAIHSHVLDASTSIETSEDLQLTLVPFGCIQIGSALESSYEAIRRAAKYYLVNTLWASLSPLIDPLERIIRGQFKSEIYKAIRGTISGHLLSSVSYLMNYMMISRSFQQLSEKLFL